MINIDQVRTLESKVKQAIQLITNLKGENQYLKTRLNDYESRIRELENLVNGFKNSQTEIEAGIINALEELDQLDDSQPDSMETDTQENHSIGSDSPQEEEPVSLNSYVTPAEETPPQDNEAAEPAPQEVSTEGGEEKYGEFSSENEEASSEKEAPQQEDQNDLGLGLY